MPASERGKGMTKEKKDERFEVSRGQWQQVVPQRTAGGGRTKVVDWRVLTRGRVAGSQIGGASDLPVHGRRFGLRDSNPPAHLSRMDLQAFSRCPSHRRFQSTVGAISCAEHSGDGLVERRKCGIRCVPCPRRNSNPFCIRYSRFA